MADPIERPPQVSSSQSQRSQPSRPSSPAPGLTRLRSGTYLDDQFHYHNSHGESQSQHEAESSSSEEELDLVENNSKDTIEIKRSMSNEIVPEVRDGIENQRDVEEGPKLEKAKSSRSSRDPNLVGWDDPDDPDNPKNWTIGRKWAATLIGEPTFLEWLKLN